MNDRELVEARFAEAAIGATEEEIDYFAGALAMLRGLTSSMYQPFDAAERRSALTFTSVVRAD